MAILAQQVIVGNIGKVYELRNVGKQNTPVVDFSVAVTPRKQVDGEWTDGDTYWVTVTAWNRLAENVVASFKSGDRVFAIGRMEMKPGYTNREGVAVDGRPVMIADFAGHEISFNPASSERRPGSGNAASRPAAKAAASKPAPKAAESAIDWDDEDDDDGLPF